MIEMPSLANRRVAEWGLLYAFLSLFALTTLALPASAKVLISVDKSTQQMSVSVDGVPRYRYAVSTGRAGYGTPNGTYRPQHLAASWFSKLYYNSPMPHSIFFHGGYAIHGSYEINRLGGPASHGCIRLHPANATALFELVKSEGMAATTIVVSGSNPVLCALVTITLLHGGAATSCAFFQVHTLEQPTSNLIFMLGVLVFAFGELLNGYHHWLLARLRAPGVRTYGVPRGGLFGWVASPHYLGEILSFVGFAMMSDLLPVWGNALVVSAYLASRANTTLKWYQREMPLRIPLGWRRLVPLAY
jgi:protein-S-isoprenylcysteine O-methyltransferase Ste14